MVKPPFYFCAWKGSNLSVVISGWSVFTATQMLAVNYLVSLRWSWTCAQTTAVTIVIMHQLGSRLWLANLCECVRCLCVCVCSLCSAWTQSVLSGLMSALAQSGFPYISPNCLQTLQQQRKCGDNEGFYSIRGCKGLKIQTCESVWFIKELINQKLWGLRMLVVIYGSSRWMCRGIVV